jgi:hypothetical protein
VNSSVNDQTVSEGSPAELSAQFAGPSPISYQWFLTPNQGARLAIAGQTAQEFKIENAQLSDGGSYELVATSTEGGIAQTLTAGPGKLTILETSAVTGSVSGTKTVFVNEPIQLTSSVSGASSPLYQWYFNSAVITGASSASFEIPNSNVSDSGTYSLVITEADKNYQIGSINVVVSCAPGQVLVSDQCYEASRVCDVTNGSGVEFINGDGEYGVCTVTACDPGFINYNNVCVPTSGNCEIENGTGTTTYSSNGQAGSCIVQTCNPGFVKVNNTCQRQVCPVDNGVGLIHLEGDSLVCRVEYCNADYIKYQGSCVPRIQSCNVQNGYGNQEYTESGPEDCQVTSCKNGYVNIQNSCVKRDCDVANGEGVIALSPSGSIQCRAVSCDSGFFLSGNQCLSQVCSTGKGVGYWATENNQQVCRLTSCNDAADVIVNNQCRASNCSAPNGQGALALDSYNRAYCMAVACNPGFALKDGVCINTTGTTCNVDHGSGSISNGQCLITSCDEGYIAYNNRCVPQTQSCDVANGRGSVNYTASGPGVCNVVKCNNGYVRQGNQCVPSTQSCFIQNGEGYRTAYSNGFSQCMVKDCNTGFGATLTQQCLPLERECYIGSGQGVQYLTSYGYSACKVSNCPDGHTMLRGVCTPDERLLCEPTDRPKSARGGKVFGYLYSLLKNKSNVNLNTATHASNRLNGHVFFEKAEFYGGDYLYDTEDQIVSHENGDPIKQWFGLALYTNLLPPDGRSSGDYILAVSSDDGSGLDCKVNGSWRNFIDHTSGNSCSIIRPANSSVTISRDEPMPLRISYFQSAGSGRCFKLMYKRVGSDDDFKVVPQSKLNLPFDTVNRCPR